MEGLEELRLELGLDSGQVTGAAHYHQFQEVWEKDSRIGRAVKQVEAMCGCQPKTKALMMTKL